MLSSSKHSKIIKIAVCLFMIASAIFLLGNFVLAGTSADLGLNYAAGTGLNSTQDIRITIAKIIRIALGFLGIIALSLIIYAGFLWMTSGGNPEKIEQAKKILQNAVIGLIIIFSAFAIASFILNMLTGGSGGGKNGPGNGPPTNYGLSALGNGIIESHYPTRNQTEVPRNTSIIITFREPMLASTLCAVNDNTDIKALCLANGADINQSVIKIFKQSDENDCVDPLKTCPSLVEAKVYSTSDNKIFVIVPINYLGSPSEYIDYTVYLGKGLRRQSGCQVGDLSKCNKAFPGLEGDYGWSFQVSNKIDLTPPQVQKNGVFPTPDNLQDTTNTSSGAKQAGGKIIVDSRPLIYSDASASVSTENPAWSATVTVDKSCSQGDIFTVSTDSDPSIIKLKDSSNRLLGQGTINGKTAVFSLCNLKLTLDGGSFVKNSLWKVTIAPMIAADTITVGDITYTASSIESGTNFRAWPANESTAQSLANVLSKNSEVNSDWDAADSNIVKVTAKFAGAAGNSLNLSSSNSAVLKIIPMAGGADQKDKVMVNGKTDQPMNSAIQINFNEAIMPLTVSGVSDDVKDFIRVVNADSAAKPTVAKPTDISCKADADCKSFKCQKNSLACEQGETGCMCVGANDYLEGKFTVSNQYETVEFLSDKECGFNNCGEKIYCLPANSHLKVELNAASLIFCADKQGKADDSLCRTYSPFNTCDPVRKFCWDGKIYFPQAAKDKPNIVDGITDAAFNSLDGNRDDSAYGKGSYYNENDLLGSCASGTNKNKVCTEENKVAVCGAGISCSGAKTLATAQGQGDSYTWSFFISNVLDLIPPKIKTTTPVISGTSVPLAAAVTISFDKLMLSSRLTTGSVTIQNGKNFITHYLLNLRSSVDQPLGYWATNIGQQSVPGSGEIDQTDAYINHTSFSKATTYTAQAGSGLKDIYQNCFLPCAGLPGNCAGVNSQKPCCCDGTPYTTCP